MIREIRARYSKGKIEPLESLDLEEGQEVVISIKEATSSFADSDWKRRIEKAAKDAGFTTEEQINELIHEQRHRTS
jgi:predicted DNA-binding antitoxin AbrB/MazE fold protein